MKENTDPRVSLAKILVATDFSKTSDRALEHALSLARTYDSRIFLAHIIPVDLMMAPELAEASREQLRRAAREGLERIRTSGRFFEMPHDEIIEEGALWPNIEALIKKHAIDLVERAAATHSSSIIDVGGGESTLVDDLLARGYHNLTVLDVSQTAIDVTKKRLGAMAQHVWWIVGDITNVQLTRNAYDVWHDRAVFHFLTAPEQRAAYVQQVDAAVRTRGYVIVSTFGPEGPTKCRGLDVMRYDEESLHRQFGVRFRLEESSKEVHQTPFGTTQQFLYRYCRVE
jgi:2-polyprenyl-3-methyl-5-hydroxy-6-metoxy-1,4-benzoquinol methylase